MGDVTFIDLLDAHILKRPFVIIFIWLFGSQNSKWLLTFRVSYLVRTHSLDQGSPAERY